MTTQPIPGLQEFIRTALEAALAAQINSNFPREMGAVTSVIIDDNGGFRVIIDVPPLPQGGAA